MQIADGVFDGSVLQRTTRNTSAARFSGTCTHDGWVAATVRRGRAVVKGYRRRRVGRAQKGTFAGRLDGLRAGGPYAVELEVTGRDRRTLERCTVEDVLVGDVWVLAGQSNMEGIGYLKDRLKPHPLVRVFRVTDTWGTAVDPLHELRLAVDPVHAILAGGKPARAPHVGVGPGVAFGQEMRRITGVPQGLIASAHGGTSMNQWDPALRDQGGKSLYGAMLRRIHRNGGQVAGVFWYQGCSDADPGVAKNYTERMVNLVASVRRDLASPRLPWVCVQIATVCGQGESSQGWNSIQEQQRLLPERIRRLAVVPAIDLALDDRIHVAGFEHPRLGRRAAQAMAVLTGHARGLKPPIEVRSVKVGADRTSGTANVVVTFGNVTGRLVSRGPAAGFEVIAAPGALLGTMVHRTDLQGSRAVVRTPFPVSEIECQFLHYGLGRKPYCNVTDQADRSLPVFGPHYLGGRRVYAPFVTRCAISRFLPSAGKLHGLAHPADKAPLALTVRQFDATFCNLHTEISGSGMDDLLVYFCARVRCAETMNTEVWLGYDGPVKMWVDGEERLFDPEGVNPALIEDSCTPVRLGTGEHEILVALGSNNLKAWGIFLRLVRTDVDPKAIARGPGAYAVPEVVG